MTGFLTVEPSLHIGWFIQTGNTLRSDSSSSVFVLARANVQLPKAG